MVAADSPVIELKNIEFSYPGAAVPTFDGLDFSFYTGSRIGLVGHNGTGKTTLFHLIMGLLKPSAGSICIFGEPVSKEADFVSVRRNIGLLFQDSEDQLFCPTVLEDVAFGPLNMGKSYREARKIAQKTLDYVGLSGFENRITGRLSGGEKRLIAFASVLAMEPEILLLDEPTTGLDQNTKSRMMEVLKELDASYLLISHELDFVLENTDSVCALTGGTVVMDAGVHFHRHVHAHVHGDTPHEHD